MAEHIERHSKKPNFLGPHKAVHILTSVRERLEQHSPGMLHSFLLLRYLKVFSAPGPLRLLFPPSAIPFLLFFLQQLLLVILPQLNSPSRKPSLTFLSVSVTPLWLWTLSLKKFCLLRLPQPMVQGGLPIEDTLGQPIPSSGWRGDQPCAPHSLDTFTTLCGVVLRTCLGCLLCLTVSPAALASPAAQPTRPWPERDVQKERSPGQVGSSLRQGP